MSSGLSFPSFIGQGWNVIKTPIWSTKIQSAVSGRELRAAYYGYCRWKFSLSFEFLGDNAMNQDLKNLIGFFNRMRGSFDDFYYEDPDDKYATNTQFGVGDGIATKFIITRPMGVDPGQPVLVNGAFQIFANGVLVPGATISNGIQLSTCEFPSAPAAGALLKWTGGYVFRCRFLNDTADFDNFMHQFWTLKKLEMITLK